MFQCTEYGGRVIAATWSELGRVNVWDLTKPLQAVESSSANAKYNNEGLETSTKALFTFQGHQKEGRQRNFIPINVTDTA
jgi:ribosome assembly protein RRB1